MNETNKLLRLISIDFIEDLKLNHLVLPFALLLSWLGLSTLCVGLVTGSGALVVLIGLNVVDCGPAPVPAGVVLLLSTQHFMLGDGH